MAKNIGVKFKLRAVDNISRVLKSVQKRMKGMNRIIKRSSRLFSILEIRSRKAGKALQRAGKMMKGFGQKMTRGITLPAGLAGAAIIRTAFNFQKKMNEVGAVTRTIVNGVVSPAFKKLEEQAKILGATTEFSATQVASAQVIMGRQSIKVKDILKITDDVLAFATATNIELADAIDIAGSALKQFGLEANQMQRVTDVLSKASISANITVEDMRETFKTAAPIARAYGASLEETSAIIALLGNVGIKGTVAGTSLKNMLLKLAAPTTKGARIFKLLNMNAENTNGTMKSLGEILTELGPKLAGLSRGKQLQALNDLFGLRGITGGVALMTQALKDGKDPVAAMTQVLQDATGTARDMQKTMQRGLVGAITRFVSALEGAALALADAGFVDLFTDILKVITSFLSKIAEFGKTDFGKFILGTVTALVGLLAVAGPLLTVIGGFIAFLPFLIAGFATLGVVTLPAVGTIALIAAGILAIVALGTLLVMNWGSISQFFADMWQDIKDIFVSSIKFIGNLVVSPIDTIANLFSGKELKGKVGAELNVNAAAQNGKNSVQTNNAQVAINMSGVPRGTKVTTSGNAPLNFNLGFAGGLQ